MGFLSFLFGSKKDQPAPVTENAEVSEDLFIQKEPTETSSDEPASTVREAKGISLLFAFLEQNHEGKGYDDALVNPDGSHLEQNLNAIKNEFERTVRKVRIFYEDFIRQVDFHIASRARSGMIDTVEELTTKKETAESHIKQVQEIELQAKNNEGPGQGILISYTRGFRNGLAAITGHSILKEVF